MGCRADAVVRLSKRGVVGAKGFTPRRETSVPGDVHACAVLLTLAVPYLL